jgi:hypothetical protein
MLGAPAFQLSTRRKTMKNQRKQWKDFSNKRRVRMIITGFVQFTMMVVMLLDLHRRPANQVKGNKRVWLMAAFVQPFGPIAYFAFGRKKALLAEA